jgi:hypothetical protein
VAPAASSVSASDTGALESLLRQSFPAVTAPEKHSSRVALIFEGMVRPIEPSPRFVFATMRLILLTDAAPGSRAVSSSWAQEVAVCHPSDLADTKRLGAYVEAWKQAADTLIKEVKPGPIWWVPFNLAGPQVLRQPQARAVADFRKLFEQKIKEGRLSL